MISIIGLGAGDLKLLTLEGYRELKSGKKVYLRTKEHPIVNDFKDEGIEFISFDYLYEKEDTFSKVYDKIVDQILKLSKKEDIIYGVPGHPLVAESTVKILIDKLSKEDYKIIGGPSFLDQIFVSLELDPIDGVKLLDGLNFEVKDLDPRTPTIISQVYNSRVGSDVKLELMEIYPDEFKIKVLRGVGLDDERIEEVPLYKLDHLDWLDSLTSIYLPPERDNLRQFNYLLEIVDILRSPGGCPWDIKQTHSSLKKHLIEEAYEVIDRIEEGDYFGLANELGDVLLQVIMHAQIASEDFRFNIYDVIEEINQKMIRRHPHIFGDVEVEDEKDVMKNWAQIKKEEKKESGEEGESILSGIPNSLPALMLAQKIQSKAAKVGFDWPEIDQVIDKVEEEIGEFKEALAFKRDQDVKEEFGDLIFALVNLGRFLDLDVEEELRFGIKKFQGRFAYVEREVKKKGFSLEEMNLEELDKLWEEAKGEDRGNYDV
ncbi:nucleoside triphosphate pyrophosphohydrolase [Halonatronum saccharophilum]|uniref:nucleoside triphosphate pyrophosphohydrolase n=1 Tax=Halonatronum saccharophilum TaxID=150060 RepID=UPI00047FE87F|nr:nucleoside triphosphate pyrophosphohydrolase [Halonatronum saccharophilum]